MYISLSVYISICISMYICMIIYIDVYECVHICMEYMILFVCMSGNAHLDLPGNRPQRDRPKIALSDITISGSPSATQCFCCLFASPAVGDLIPPQTPAVWSS